MPDKKYKPECVFVLGMHRSGTSALTGVLQKQGIDLGQKLMKGIGDVNDLGFFEHEEIAKIHDNLLEALGSSWLDLRPLPDLWWRDDSVRIYHEKIKSVLINDFGDKQLWGIKDPRMCRILPLWLDILDELGCVPKIIIIVRHPLEVSRSLLKRDEMDETWSCILWLWHVLDAYNYSSKCKRVVIQYDELLDDWTDVSERISQEIEIEWPISISDARKDVEAFLDVKMRHHHISVDDSRENPDLLVEMAIDVYENLFINNVNIGEIEKKFHNEILRIEPYLKGISDSLSRASTLRNDVRNLESEKNITLRNLESEKTNARTQIEYRDLMINELNEQIEDEKTNAREQIEHRDKLIDGLKIIIDELNNKMNDFWFIIKRPVIILIKKIFP